MMGLLGGDKKNQASAIVEKQHEKSEPSQEAYDEKRPHNNMEDEMYGELMGAFKSGCPKKLKKAFGNAFEYSYMKMKK